MAVTLREMRRWIAAHDLSDNAMMYIDEDGLVLCGDDPGGTHVAYLEVGEKPEGDDE